MTSPGAGPYPGGVGQRGGDGRLAAGLVVLLLAGTALAGQEPVARIIGLRHFSSPGYTRVVVDLSAPARHRVAVVAPSRGGSPRRIYIDFPHALPGARVPKRQAISGGLLGSVRLGLGDEGGARVVLDVRSIRDYRIFQLSSPPRLVIDVRGTGKRGHDRHPPRVAPKAPGAHHRRGRRGKGKPGAAVQRPAARLPRLRIVLDPGHGGRDPGARGPGGITEKVVTLAIARRVAARLRSLLGARVVLTRTRDEFVPLEARTARANAEEADIFVSIHANASPSRRLRGVETYYLDNTDDRATIRLAAMENGLGQLGVPPAAASKSTVRYILSDLVQVGKMEESIALAQAVQNNLVRSLARRYPGVHDLGVKRGPFYVLVGTYMPCVLVEVSFIDNPIEGRRLADPAYQDALAEGIYRGIVRFAAEHSRARNL